MDRRRENAIRAGYLDADDVGPMTLATLAPLALVPEPPELRAELRGAETLGAELLERDPNEEAQEAQARANDGSQWAGQRVVQPGQRVNCVIRGRFDPAEDPGKLRALGLCAVHVSITDEVSGVETAIPRQRLVGILRYGSKQAGGEMRVDLTRGGIFTVGASHSIELDVSLEALGPGVAFSAGSAKRVEVSAHYSTSMAPRAAYWSDYIVFGGAGTSARLPVPSQARNAFLVSDTAGAVAASTLSFFQDSAGGGAAVYATVAPSVAIPSPVVGGAEFYSVTAGGANLTQVVWELWP